MGLDAPVVPDQPSSPRPTPSKRSAADARSVDESSRRVSLNKIQIDSSTEEFAEETSKNADIAKEQLNIASLQSLNGADTLAGAHSQVLRRCTVAIR